MSKYPKDLPANALPIDRRLNAIKHGITSNSPVIPGIEDEAAWQRHRDGIRDSLGCEGLFEEVFAERVASLTWRLYRVVRFEVTSTMNRIEGVAQELATLRSYAAGVLARGEIIEADPKEVDERQFSQVLPPDADLDRIMRYEPILHRQLIQMLHELQAHQDRRKGLPAHLARLDISSPPSA